MVNIYFDQISLNLQDKIKELFTDIDIPVNILSSIDRSISEAYLFINLNSNQDIYSYLPLKQQHQNYQFICVSNNDELVFDALCLFPIHFIRLNNIDNDIEILKSRLSTFINQKSNITAISNNKTFVSLDRNNIKYIEALDHYQFIYTLNSSIQIRSNIAKLLKELGSELFIQIHRSFIVNIKHVKAIKGSTIILDNNKELPIGRLYKAKVKEKSLDLK